MPSAGGITLAADISSPPQILLLALLLISAAVVLFRKAASRYFLVEDATFGVASEMSIGGCEGGGGDNRCGVCGGHAPKKCSGCKSVFYCSPVCQLNHWKGGHKFKCRKIRPSISADLSSAPSSVPGSKSFRSSSVALVSARSCKILQEPKKVLFPYDEFVKLFNWDKPGFPPCGLINCGNSCFANVVLQCLSFTRPLTAYLLDRDHHKDCKRRLEDWCFLCELQVHIQRVVQSLDPFSPISILSRIRNIGGNLGYGKQEDAHEFMRFAIDTMQAVCLDEFGGEKSVSLSSQETTIVQHIFGGYLQSQVTCTNCNVTSNCYERMMDLAVEIHGDACSLEEFLDQFTEKEPLDGENMYKCAGCNDYVKAWKRLSVHQAPNVLTIILKRFQSGRFGKLNKRITFPDCLDLTPYMSGEPDGSDQYMLYAVVVHVDMLNASFFGHYICYTKDFSGRWYRIDDCKVKRVEIDEVLAENAYMLLYIRKNVRSQHLPKSIGNVQEAAEVGAQSMAASKTSDGILKTDSEQENNGASEKTKKTIQESGFHVQFDVDLSAEKPSTRLNVLDGNGRNSASSKLKVHSEDLPEPSMENVLNSKPRSEETSYDSTNYDNGDSQGSGLMEVEEVETLNPILPSKLMESPSSPDDEHEANSVCSMDCDDPIEYGNTAFRVGDSMNMVRMSEGRNEAERRVELTECNSSLNGVRPSDLKEPFETTVEDVEGCRHGSDKVSCEMDEWPELSSSSGAPSSRPSPVERYTGTSTASPTTETSAFSVESASGRRPKTLFVRGFLDRPARKKHVGVTYKVNGYANGFRSVENEDGSFRNSDSSPISSSNSHLKPLEISGVEDFVNGSPSKKIECKRKAE